jgi:L-aminopeptidase/D-esterase-like protein
MDGRPTGCTVILAERGAVASVDVRGGAPATRETDLLRPENLVQQVHAIVLSGGSAYGLDSATGVMKYLEERSIGYKTRAAVVPIVPGASLIDLAFGGDAKVRPDAACGYRAAQAASTEPVREGNVGAGAGATVGKLFGMSRAMKAGVGSASIAMPDGLVVAALVAVNAFGDIIDPATGTVVAGLRTADGRALADTRRLLREGAPDAPAQGALDNTTIGVVATNARLSKAHAYKVAQMAHDGYARAIAPVHTPYDGDAIFALATGAWTSEPDLALIGALAADAVAMAVVRAATQASASGGLPSAKDLRR